MSMTEVHKLELRKINDEWEVASVAGTWHSMHCGTELRNEVAVQGADVADGKCHRLWLQDL